MNKIWSIGQGGNNSHLCGVTELVFWTKSVFTNGIILSDSVPSLVTERLLAAIITGEIFGVNACIK